MKKIKHGFTLIELLVVIAIIGILIAVGGSSYQRAVRLSRDSKRKADIEQIRQALETFRSENGLYPTAAQGGLNALDPDYIQTIPTDPKGTGYLYDYQVGSPATTYYLCGQLEVTTSIPAPCGNTSMTCGTASGNCNYGTTNP